MAVWSAVNFSVVQRTGRFDAEYYQPKFLEYERRARQHGGTLGHFLYDIIQPTEFIREYVDDGAMFWRAQNVRPGYIDTTNIEHIDRTIYKAIPKSHVREGDVLITRTGANAGDCAVVPAGTNDVAVSSHTLRLVPKSVELGYAIGTFFASGLGRDILFRTVSGSSRPQITKEMLLAVPVPDFSDIAREVKRDIHAVDAKREQSKQLYVAAERLLLYELHLDTLNLTHQLTYERNFSEIYKADRFDAEYYQPKYYHLLQAVRNAGEGYRRLDQLVEPVRNGFDFREFTDEGTPYIRVGDIRKGRINLLGAAHIPITIDDVKKDVALEIGDVLFTRKGTFGQSAVVQLGQEHAIISSEIMLLRLSTKHVLPDYLSLFLNSLPGYMQVERRVHGVAYFSISQPDLATVELPMLPMVIQEHIAATLQQSLQAEQDAKQLLEKAKKRVEDMILAQE